MREEIEQAPSGPEPGWDSRRYAALLLKHIWALLTVVTLCTVGGGYYASTRASVYQATANIVIETTAPQILQGVAPVVDPSGNQGYWGSRVYRETQLRILESTPIANEVAARLGLDSDLDFLGLRSVDDPEELREALEVANPGSRVRAAVSVEADEDSRAVMIHARAGNPDTAALLANTLAEVYIERNLERQLESTVSAADWIEDQYDGLRTELEASEAALVDFRRDHNLIAVDLAGNVSLASQMETTSAQLAEARLESDRLRSVVRQIDSVLADGDVLDADIEAVVDNTLIQSLKAELYDLEAERIALSARYLDEHPQMLSVVEREELARERLEREIGNVLNSYRGRAERAEDVVNLLERRLGSVEQQVQRLGTHEVTYGALVREAEANRELFDMIANRRKEIELTRNSQHNNIEMLEAAAPPLAPIAPNKLALLIAAFGLGLVLATAVALILETFDSSVKSQETLEREFGLTFLGLIPRIKPSLSSRPTKRGPARGQTWSPDTYAHDYPKSVVAESCRSIRTNLTFMATEGPLRTLLVTSPGPREGKTTTSLSIATVMAQSGTRILLVDADMRRPRVHTVFDWTNDVGLTSILVDGVEARTAVRRTPIPNLDILTSGPVPPNPAELMESDRFREVIDKLAQNYDRVIFDSPPVAPVTDATILSSIADGVLLVIRSSVTRKELIGKAVALLSAVNSNIVGAVLNDVDLNSRQNGYHYYYYYRHYGHYYGDGDESEAA